MDLEKLEANLNSSLSKETPESLKKWLISKRRATKRFLCIRLISNLLYGIKNRDNTQSGSYYNRGKFYRWLKVKA